jgi:hypothetical protein
LQRASTAFSYNEVYADSLNNFYHYASQSVIVFSEGLS